MPFRIIRSDISKVKADAIVNTANPEPTFGRGSDYAVYQAAGMNELLAAREKIGKIQPGHAAATPAFRLPARYLIHTVGPKWRGGYGKELEILASCYRESLRLAKELGCESVAFPLISSGYYGFPKDQALSVALEEISDFLEKEEMEITLVVFDRCAFELSAALGDPVRQYIDENYVEERREEEYSGKTGNLFQRLFRRKKKEEAPEESFSEEESPAEWDREELSGSSDLAKCDMEEELAEESSGGFWSSSLDYAPAPPSEDEAEPPAEDEAAPTPRGDAEPLPGAGRRKPAGYPALRPRGARASSAPPSFSAPSGSAAPSAPSAPSSFSAPSGSAASSAPSSFSAPSGSAAPAAPSAPSAHAAPKAAMPLGKASLDAGSNFRPREDKGKGGFRLPNLSLKDRLKHMGENFQEMLLRLIDERGLTDSQVYKKANVDRKLFSKIRCHPDYTPGKRTVVALAVALELNLDETTDLLRRAGLALSPSSKFDLIVEFCIMNRIYNIYEINAILFEYDQPLLGC